MNELDIALITFAVLMVVAAGFTWFLTHLIAIAYVRYRNKKNE